MNDGNVQDPLGHIKIVVGDFKKSYSFYRGIFEELGYKQVSDKSNRAGWVSPEGFGIWIAQAKIPNHAYKFSAPGLHHLCLKAQSTEQVDKLYQFAQEKHAFIFDSPQRYPNYTGTYYAVFFADPDGIKLEIAYY